MSMWSTAGGAYGMTSMEAGPDEPARDAEPVKLAQALGERAAAHRADPHCTYVTEVARRPRSAGRGR